MEIPFVDLKRMHEPITREIIAALEKVITHGIFINGPEVKQFEKEFAHYCEKKFAVGVASGTEALTLTIIAYDIKNSEIIIPAHTFIATALAVKHSGNTPVLVDVDATGNIDIAQIEKKITQKTKAIIPVHLYGQPAQMEKILALAQKHKLIVIEDCCQAHSAEIQNKKVPFTETGCFSFYPAKNLGCFGDGGMVVTDNEKIYKTVTYLREYGSSVKYHHDYREGFNSRLDTIQAAVLSVKLKKLEESNTLRIKAAQRYCQEITGIKGITLPGLLPSTKHVYHLFTILAQQRDELQTFLKGKGISTGIHYPIPIHLQKMFQYLGYNKGDFPVTEQFSRETLSLPLYPNITSEEIRYVCSAINDFYREK